MPPKSYKDDPKGWDQFWDDTRKKDSGVVTVCITESLLRELINFVRKELIGMSESVDRVERATAEITADATAVKSAVDALRAIIADLQSQIASGAADQARLDAAAASLEAADAALDSAVAEPTPAPTESPSPTA